MLAGAQITDAARAAARALMDAEPASPDFAKLTDVARMTLGRPDAVPTSPRPRPSRS